MVFGLMGGKEKTLEKRGRKDKNKNYEQTSFTSINSLTKLKNIR